MMTEERLRALYGPPTERAARKVLRRLDGHCRAFIAASPFCVMATGDGAGLDVSPKGDPAGFVAVEDDATLLIPDRPGNNRIDGLTNLLRNPAVALLFLIPTVDETLRVNGRAEILDDPDLCGRFAVNGRAPKTTTRVTVEEVFLHCGKAPLRGGLWRPESWPPARPVPTLGAILRDHAGMPGSDPSQEAADRLYRETLY
jgi:PPOX class probable FMN-dependent enzyme